MPYLSIISNDGRTYDFPMLKDEIVIGRSKDNDIILHDNTVSRNHASIMKTREGYLLADLGSFNGIVVNGKPIQSVILKADDLIRIGRTRLTFLTGRKPVFSPVDSLILTPSSGAEDGEGIVRSSLEAPRYRDFREFLISAKKPDHALSVSEAKTPPQHAGRTSPDRADISSLERANKVLFVLCEISRELNSIQDFDELLNKIMDLVFMVIDADSGFLILTGREEIDELIPVVVKYRDQATGDKKELRASRTLINKVIRDKVALLTSNAMDDSRLDHGKSLFLRQIRSAMCVPLWKKDKIIGVIQLESVRLNNPYTQDDLQLLQAIGSQMAMIVEQASLNEQIREEERMRSRLERFHSPQIIEMILEGGQETKDNIMEPKDLTATILFADIVGFTRLSEQMPPREVNLILNQFFSRMTDIVFEYGGMLDKYMGDALMAVFGAPMEKEGDAERAIMAAQKMRRVLTGMMDKTEDAKRFNIHLGINTGRVTAGNMGSPKRMEYTVIGDPVNVASRLEAIARPNQILIGEETFRHVEGRFRIRKFGPRKVKGKSAEIMVYEVLD